MIFLRSCLVLIKAAVFQMDLAVDALRSRLVGKGDLDPVLPAFFKVVGLGDADGFTGNHRDDVFNVASIRGAFADRNFMNHDAVERRDLSSVGIITANSQVKPWSTVFALG